MRRALPVLLLLAACTGSATSEGRPVVAASGYALGWLVGQVGGGAVRVVDAGDPHGPAQAPDADLVVLLPGQQGPDGDVLDLSDAVGVRPAASDLGDEEGGADPHVWLDPVRMQAAATALGARLEDLAPGSTRRAVEVVAALRRLDRRYADGLAGCDRRTVVASHTAFGALAERYDLLHAGVAGLTPDAAPGPGRVAEVQRLAAEDATTTVFVVPGEEDLAGPAVDDLGAATQVLEALEAAPAEGDYLAAMDRNLATLRAGLGCA